MTRPSLEFDIRSLRAARSPRATSAPTVSVVVASFSGRQSLHAFVAEAAPLCARAEAEILIVRSGSAAEAQSLGKQLPGTRVVHAPPGADAATMRRVGLSKAAGDIVAFVDADQHIDAAWLEALASTGTTAPTAAGRLSVVVPARDAAATLPQSLGALAASDLPRDRWELIVVDDGSDDDTPLAAAEFADTIVRLTGGAHGPAYARNRGADAARGAVVVFVDPTVAVHRDALRRFAELFEREPALSAAYGTLDTAPTQDAVVSQYQALRHHFTHRGEARDADTFWAGCGAVRATAFAEIGMFDEWRFRRPEVEDAELAQRLRARGDRIAMRPEILSTSLAEWTLRDLVSRDVAVRAIPRVRLVSDGGSAAADTHGPGAVEVASTLLAWLIVLGTLATLIAPGRALLALATTVVSVAAFTIVNRRLLAFFARARGPGFALAALAVHALASVVHGLAVVYGYVVHHALGDPNPEPAVQAFSEVGVKTWPPVPRKR